MMLRQYWCYLLMGLMSLLPAVAVAEPLLTDYQLDVRLDPPAGSLQVDVSMSLPAAAKTLDLLLHADLKLSAGAGVASLQPLDLIEAQVPLRRYRLTPVSGATQVGLHYTGRISHAVTDSSEGFGRSFESTPGMIAADGVFLSAASGWFPLPLPLQGRLFRFDLRVQVPAAWEVISQGKSGDRAALDGHRQQQWSEQHPQDDIYLLAAPFHRYQQTAFIGEPPQRVRAEAYLRSPDEALAGRYLGATGRYLDLYSRLLGDYPYAKFALVENVWESGYGMPSFTLLGSQVLRLPFILHTSYPHEILHNWWGNGVYIADQGGNWAEGLTAYLSDYLFKAMRGRAAEYRRDVLQRYSDFVGDGSDGERRDFPLTQFRGRHGPVTQAVGYGKAMMVFHMLRRQIGDRAFLQGLRRFYAEQRFQYAAWSDIQAAMEAASSQPLGAFFDQWLSRSGAPRLALSAVSAEQRGEQWRLRGTLSQQQPGPAYRLQVPVLVQLLGSNDWLPKTLLLQGQSMQFDWGFDRQPIRLWLDPGFELFRRLHPAEVSPVLSGLFGSPRPLVVLPSDDPNLASWRAMVAGWARRGGDWQQLMDDQLDQLPSDRSVLLLGSNNRLLAGVPAITSRRKRAELRIDGHAADPQRDALVIVDRHPGNPEQVLAWISADDPAQRPLLARKLPHYGKYGYLLMRDGKVTLKGQWPIRNSPLRIDLTGAEGMPPGLPAGPPLTELIGE